MWIKCNPNPQGCSVGDCTVRAVAAATGQSWEQAYIGLAITGYALGDMPSANRTWGAYQPSMMGQTAAQPTPSIIFAWALFCFFRCALHAHSHPVILLHLGHKSKGGLRYGHV